mgnify:CR=1 FL=1
MVRLPAASADIKEWIAAGRLSMGQARPLLQLPSAKGQREAALYIMKHELSARKTEALVRHLMTQAKPRPEPDAMWPGCRIS